jgi:hypothetical protein
MVDFCGSFGRLGARHAHCDPGGGLEVMRNVIKLQDLV